MTRQWTDAEGRTWSEGEPRGGAKEPRGGAKEPRGSQYADPPTDEEIAQVAAIIAATPPRYLKQVIVVRKDLGMPTGKTATMVAHASMKWLADKYASKRALSLRGLPEVDTIVTFTSDQLQWLTELDPGIEHTGQQSFAKIVVFVSSEEELLAVQRKAEARGLTIGTAHDSGFSHNPIGTFVAIAVGPHWPESFEGVTDHLKTR
jgi:PTH2 family peptidyl-tRNA hydrolase